LYDSLRTRRSYRGDAATPDLFAEELATGRTRFHDVCGRMLSVSLHGRLLDVADYNERHGFQSAQKVLAQASNRMTPPSPQTMGGPLTAPFVPGAMRAISPAPSALAPSPQQALALPLPQALLRPKTLWDASPCALPKQNPLAQGRAIYLEFPLASELWPRLTAISDNLWYRTNLCPGLIQAAGRQMTIEAFDNFLLIALSDALDTPACKPHTLCPDIAHRSLVDTMIQTPALRALVHDHYDAMTRAQAQFKAAA
jgi:hypothetical protein